MFTIYRVAFRGLAERYPVEYEHLSDIGLSTLETSTAKFRSVTEIARKSSFSCVRPPIRYGFRTGAKAIPYSANIALGNFQVSKRSRIGPQCV